MAHDLPRTPGVHSRLRPDRGGPACGQFEIVRPWNRERGVLFGCFAAAAVAQAGAFLRADTTHLFNVMLVTPILVGATAALAGQVLGLRSAW